MLITINVLIDFLYLSREKMYYLNGEIIMSVCWNQCSRQKKQKKKQKKIKSKLKRTKNNSTF